MTRVVHKAFAPYDVYIGRPTKWGNPFIIGRDGTREEVIAKYIDMHAGDEKFLAMVRKELKGKVLGCWCKFPGNEKACHGDWLAEVADREEK